MKTRNISLDSLKIILAIFIVLLHCGFFREFSEKISYLTVQGLFRIAVPTFFIINGFFFENTLKNNNIKNWIKRVLLLYLIWSIIYLPLWTKFNIISVIIYVFIGYHHLWYLKAMLLSGILLFYLRNLKTKFLLSIAVSTFFIGVVIQYIGNYDILKSYELIHKFTNFTPIHRNFIFLGLPFFIIGYLIKVNSWHKKVHRHYLIIGVISGIIILICECYLNYSFTNEGNDNLLALMLICPFIFIFILNLNLAFNINSKYIALISTSIYLIHPWIMKILMKTYKFEPTMLSFTTILISFLVSFFLIKLNNKLKVLL
jgi:surface polysaccharide O-acyltransferase-like enzyme